MRRILILIILCSLLILSGCSSYDAEFNKCKEIKVSESGCIKFTRFSCNNRTVDYELEKQCYKELTTTPMPTKADAWGDACKVIEVEYKNGTIDRCLDKECMPKYLDMYKNRTNIINWQCKVGG